MTAPRLQSGATHGCRGPGRPDPAAAPALVVASSDRTVLRMLAVLLVFDRLPAAGLFLLPVAIWAVKAAGQRPIRLGTATGQVTFPHRWARRRRVPLSRGVELFDDGRQALVLHLRGNPRARVPILRLTRALHRSQRRAVLHLLAEQLDRHTPASASASASAPVADRLRTPADFLAAEARPPASPLAASIRSSNRWTGVGAGLSDLLDTLLPGR